MKNEKIERELPKFRKLVEGLVCSDPKRLESFCINMSILNRRSMDNFIKILLTEPFELPTFEGITFEQMKDALSKCNYHFGYDPEYGFCDCGCLCYSCEESKKVKSSDDIQKYEIKYPAITNPLISHEPNCSIWDCKKENCWQLDPDKIVKNS